MDIGAQGAVALPQRVLLPVLDPGLARVFVAREEEMARSQQHLKARLPAGAHCGAGRGGWRRQNLAWLIILLQTAAAQDATVISATCQRLEQELPFAPWLTPLGRYLYGLPDAVMRACQPPAWQG